MHQDVYIKYSKSSIMKSMYTAWTSPWISQKFYTHLNFSLPFEHKENKPTRPPTGLQQTIIADKTEKLHIGEEKSVKGQLCIS